jgi:hypothetical protein
MTEEQKERKRSYQKVWKRLNAERINAQRRAQRKLNPGPARNSFKIWYQANSERKRAQSRAWKRDNPDRNKAIIKAWNKNNPEQAALRSRMHCALKYPKSKSTMKLLGCDINWLRAWLEVSFKPGMTWENYGPGWHVDHIRPCASFDLSDPSQQKLCFHFTNLQPLWAEENQEKYNKWEGAA